MANFHDRGPMYQLHRLPREELAAVLTSPYRHVLAIGVEQTDEQCLVLYLGDLTTRIVPLSTFESNGDGPDLDGLKLGDYGHWICLGAYEARTETVVRDLPDEATPTHDGPGPDVWLYSTHQLLVLAAIEPSIATAAIRCYLQRLPWDEVQALVEELAGIAVDPMAETQYQATKEWLRRFETAIAEASLDQSPLVDAAISRAIVDGLRAQASDLRQEIEAYEAAVHDRVAP